MKSLTSDQFRRRKEKELGIFKDKFLSNIYQNAQIAQYFRFSHRDVHAYALKPPKQTCNNNLIFVYNMKPST